MRKEAVRLEARPGKNCGRVETCRSRRKSRAKRGTGLDHGSPRRQHGDRADSIRHRELLAEFERNLIIERSKAGQAIARSNGKKFGRPNKLTASLIRQISLIRGEHEALSLSHVAPRVVDETEQIYSICQASNNNVSPDVVQCRALADHEQLSILRNSPECIHDEVHAIVVAPWLSMHTRSLFPHP